MGRHAYLIIAHTNIYQLNKLINLIDDPRNDIYLLIDKKSKLDTSELTKCKYSNLNLVDRLDIFWGGFSQIKAELSLFEAAIVNDYSYYHLISGMDLPLHSQDYIHKFFDKNSGYEYIAFVNDEIYKKTKPSRRLRYYYRFQDKQYNNRLGRFLIKLQEKIDLPIQRRFKVNRLKNKDFVIGYGTNWASVSDEFAKYIVYNKSWIYEIFNNSSCGDELYKQTLLLNGDFKDKLYIKDKLNDKKEDRQGTLRYINWWDGSPKVWTIDDKEELLEARDRGYLFSRKFDERVDNKIIEYIYDLVKNDEDLDLKEGF